MLCSIKSIEQYYAIYEKYVAGRNTKNYTNYFLDSAVLLKFVKSDKVKYSINGDALFLFIDRGDYYMMLFSGVSGDTYAIPSADKEISCDVFEMAESGNRNEKELNALFLKNGFICKHKYEQFRLSYGKLHKRAIEYVEQNYLAFQQMGLSVEPPKLKDKQEIEDLISSKISKYDKLDLSTDEWKSQVNNGNIICIYKDDILAAVYCFSHQAGRIVVKEQYQGKNLSTYLRMYFAAQPRWENSQENQYAWVEFGNLASKKALIKVDAINTGKLKYRYIKEQ